MNKKRRKEIYDIIVKLQEIIKMISIDVLTDIVKQISNLVDDLDYIHDEEYNYAENMPENLQNGYRYERAEEACDAINDAISFLSNIDVNDSITYINNNITKAIDCLHDAI